MTRRREALVAAWLPFEEQPMLVKRKRARSGRERRRVMERVIPQLGAGVELAVDGFEAGLVNGGVDLSGGDVAVA
jgi:hypothetical protein